LDQKAGIFIPVYDYMLLIIAQKVGQRKTRGILIGRGLEKK
jgi:hypothetical protein